MKISLSIPVISSTSGYSLLHGMAFCVVQTISFLFAFMSWVVSPVMGHHV